MKNENTPCNAECFLLINKEKPRDYRVALFHNFKNEIARSIKTTQMGGFIQYL